MGQELYRNWLDTAGRNRRRIAVCEPATGRSVRFGDLLARVSSLAAGLADPSDWRNGVIAFQFRNSAEWLEAFLLCQATGAIALPLDPDIPPEGIQAICAEVQPILFWDTAGRHPMAHQRRRRPACLVKMTSGSSGAPRALFFEDQQMIADGRQIIMTMGIRPQDSNLAAIPLGHSYGLGNLVMPLLLQATSICLCNEPFPHSLAGAIAAARATVFPAVPPLLNALTRADIPARQIASLRLIISAGSPLDPRDANAFHARFGRKIHNFYGSTETGGIAYDADGDDTLSGASVGRPLIGVQTAVRPSGRLWVSSPAVHVRGNRLRHKGAGAFLLPDFVEQAGSGKLRIRGRAGRLLKVGGKRLEPGEVEQAILALDGVSAVHVAPYADRRGRVRLAAAIVSSRPEAALRSALRARLPEWKLPTRWVRLAAFPLTGRGKTDVTRLCDLLQHGSRSADRP